MKNVADSPDRWAKTYCRIWDDLGGKLNVTGHVMFQTKIPPGHDEYCGIAAQKAKSRFHKTVRAYTLPVSALFDSFIQCAGWKFVIIQCVLETVINKYLDQREAIPKTPPFRSIHAVTVRYGRYRQKRLQKCLVTISIMIRGTGVRHCQIAFTSFRQVAGRRNNAARFLRGIHFHPVVSWVQSNTARWAIRIVSWNGSNF